MEPFCLSLAAAGIMTFAEMRAMYDDVFARVKVRDKYSPRFMYPSSLTYFLSTIPSSPCPLGSA